MIQGGKYHLLDLQESVNNLVDEFHKKIPVDNNEDLLELDIQQLKRINAQLLYFMEGI